MEPDSISRRDAVLSFRFRFFERRMLKTEAASVEAMTEPMSRLSRTGRFNTRKTKPPTSPAVRSTPMVDRRIAWGITGRASLMFVPKPP